MIFDIFKTINNFFEIDSELFTIYTDQMTKAPLEKIYKPFEEKYGEKLRTSVKFEGLLPKNQELIDGLVKFYKSMDISEITNFLSEYIRALRDNFELIFYMSPLFEKNLYETINPELQLFLRKYTEEFEKICEWYCEKHYTQLSLNQDLTSIPLIYEEIKKIEENWQEESFLDLMKFQSRIFSKIEKVDEQNFKLHFSSFVLKTADIIEDKVKPLFLILLSMKDIEEGRDFDVRKNQGLTLGTILFKLDKEKNFKNLWRLVIYRNARFHSGVSYIYDKDFHKRTLIFKDKHEIVKREIHQFILDLEKIYRMINTLNTLITTYCINIKAQCDNPLSLFLNKLEKEGLDTDNKNETLM